MEIYASDCNSGLQDLKYNQGEDRWLSTLLIKVKFEYFLNKFKQVLLNRLDGLWVILLHLLHILLVQILLKSFLNKEEDGLPLL